MPQSGRTVAGPATVIIALTGWEDLGGEEVHLKMASSHSKKGYGGKGELCLFPSVGEMKSGKSSVHTGAVLDLAGSKLPAAEGTFELGGSELTLISWKENLRPLERGTLRPCRVACSYT